MLEQLGKLVATVGVPAAVAFYVLYRVDATLGELRDAVRELATVVLRLCAER